MHKHVVLAAADTCPNPQLQQFGIAYAYALRTAWINQLQPAPQPDLPVCNIGDVNSNVAISFDQIKNLARRIEVPPLAASYRCVVEENIGS